MKEPLLDLLRGHEGLAELDPPSRRLALRAVVREHAAEEDLGDALERICDWIDGFGPLSAAMSDPEVTDILVNGNDEVWLERAGSLQRSSLAMSPPELTHLIERMLAACGARADVLVPIADGRLPDGSRIHVVVPPISGHSPVVSIRKFPQRAYTLDALLGFGSLRPEEAVFLRAAVAERKTMAISGGTGSGKTTLANALLACVPAHERVIVIEETPELRPVCEHHVSLFTRPPNIEGRGHIDQTALVRAALRMRPDRIVIGEVRGPEALDALHAMSTGHEGSLVTVHARSASDAPERLLDLALMAPDAPGEQALRRKVERSLDIVVHMERRGGLRRIVQIMDL